MRNSPAFSDALKRELRAGKYTRWAEGLTEDTLRVLLWAVGEIGYRRAMFSKESLELRAGKGSNVERRIRAALEMLLTIVAKPETTGQQAWDEFTTRMQRIVEDWREGRDRSAP